MIDQYLANHIRMTQQESVASFRRRPQEFALFVAGLFFFSGFAALVYQVTWMRHLSLFFGSDVYSAAITLSVFMGGLSLGSYVAERVEDRVTRPLLIYGLIEILIGLYALFFTSLLGAFTPLLKHLYQAYFETAHSAYEGARILIAAAVLLFPTTLMGATLPLIVKNFVRHDSDVGRFGGLFYAINTLGALAGVIVAAFALIPNFGITTTTHIAVGINIAVGAVVILSVGNRRATSGAPTAGAWEKGEAPLYRYEPVSAWFALTAICISGLSALALEVVWTRVLTLSFSATVYSFSIMLASFLFGIFQGSRIASQVIDQRLDPVRYFGFLECGIGVSVALLALLSFIAPALFGWLLWGFTAVTRGNFGFASVVAQFIVSGLLISLPTLLLGATFPAAVKICTPSAARAGFGTGRVYAANTAGAILVLFWPDSSWYRYLAAGSACW